MYLDVLFKVVGGLGLFLYGMENMSSGMQKIAGDKLKKILAALTTNRIMAILMGIFVTGLAQSSSVSTVMTIGFINASLLTLQQGLGVILGANIGTTITGWLLALNIGKYGLPIVGFAAIAFMFVKGEKSRTRALTVMGFGFIFLGLELMSKGLSPLRTLPEFINLFHSFKADSFFGVVKVAMVGALLTGVVQSSAATLGITITLATQGLIDYPTAVALVLGENVGTTVTALLASIGASSNAKRAAYAHTLINIVGVMWATVIFRPYLSILAHFSDSTANMATAIATAHTMFNVINVILFIPFIGYLAKFLCTIVKDDDNGVVRVTKLSSLMVTLPNVVIDQTRTEVLTMAANIKEIFFKLEEVYYNPSKLEAYNEEIDAIEEKLDLYEKEVSDANFTILNKGLEASYVEETRGNLITCDEYETISDYLKRVSNSLMRLKKDDLELTQERKETLQKLNHMVFDFFDDINKAYKTKDRDLFMLSISKYTAIKNLYKEARHEHFDKEAQNDETIPAKLSTGYMDILNYYRRATDHVYNIIEHYAKI
ncbi:MAG: Na/Pi cotransporter family protein [Fusobacterium sp.]|mgnify:FL=1|jgi:phosphate:Na+ symporter|uniref:Na/Pi cotransporter family protein n=1 Tax=Fusobacterium sp. TaxID=68766 RepID=UPI002E79EA77|nr:Na/Pi cotransporter family protein [Fusobacterium sp.]MEE1476225.1 Na/Pi cotransporter family protein [Fusobacterium sp.]